MGAAAAGVLKHLPARARPPPVEAAGPGHLPADQALHTQAQQEDLQKPLKLCPIKQNRLNIISFGP